MGVSSSSLLDTSPEGEERSVAWVRAPGCGRAPWGAWRGLEAGAHRGFFYSPPRWPAFLLLLFWFFPLLRLVPPGGSQDGRGRGRSRICCRAAVPRPQRPVITNRSHTPDVDKAEPFGWLRTSRVFSKKGPAHFAAECKLELIQCPLTFKLKVAWCPAVLPPGKQMVLVENARNSEQ